MTSVDRWQLPDGIEEVLPAQAATVEQLRRRLLDMFRSWGYELVIPPLVEFTDSLLSGLGQDLALLTNSPVGAWVYAPTLLRKLPALMPTASHLRGCPAFVTQAPPCTPAPSH